MTGFVLPQSIISLLLIRVFFRLLGTVVACILYYASIYLTSTSTIPSLLALVIMKARQHNSLPTWSFSIPSLQISQSTLPLLPLTRTAAFNYLALLPFQSGFGLL
ncbi:hypothetical protein DL96DRAFT_1589670 [Flagelloscypha sp. PMI_526]|nr:hypothetical protein DL96DRAFT_1589670 [Flagelloscypha sp. PMI_526]